MQEGMLAATRSPCQSMWMVDLIQWLCDRVDGGLKFAVVTTSDDSIDHRGPEQLAHARARLALSLEASNAHTTRMPLMPIYFNRHAHSSNSHTGHTLATFTLILCSQLIESIDYTRHNSRSETLRTIADDCTRPARPDDLAQCCPGPDTVYPSYPSTGRPWHQQPPAAAMSSSYHRPSAYPPPQQQPAGPYWGYNGGPPQLPPPAAPPMPPAAPIPPAAAAATSGILKPVGGGGSGVRHVEAEWVLTLEQVYRQSPSQRDGLDDATERRLRREGCRLAEQMALKLDMYVRCGVVWLI